MNSPILLMAAILDELLLFGCDSVGGTDGGQWAVVVAVVIGLSAGVGQTESPMIDNALAECNTDLEDICAVQLC